MTSPPRTLILLGILGLAVAGPATLATADEPVSGFQIIIVSNDISNTTTSFRHAGSSSSESSGSDAQAAGDGGDAAAAGSGDGDNADGAESPNGAAPDSEPSADGEAGGGGAAPSPSTGGGGGGGGCVDTGTFQCDDEHSWSRSD